MTTHNVTLTADEIEYLKAIIIADTENDALNDLEPCLDADPVLNKLNSI